MQHSVPEYTAPMNPKFLADESELRPKSRRPIESCRRSGRSATVVVPGVPGMAVAGAMVVAGAVAAAVDVEAGWGVAEAEAEEALALAAAAAMLVGFAGLSGEDRGVSYRI